MFEEERLVTEPCGCRYDIPTWIRTKTCAEHDLVANLNELCARLRRERAELLLEIVELLSQMMRKAKFRQDQIRKLEADLWQDQQGDSDAQQR